MPRQSGEQAPRGAWREHAFWRAWGPALGLATALGCAHFLAARLGLVLLSKAEGVAIFWPAAGVAAGALIVLEQRARPYAALGILGAVIVANLLSGKGSLTAVSFALCNVSEALLTAWLVDRWSGRPFKFDDLRGIWGFLAAAALAPAAVAVLAALATRQFYMPASLSSIWRVWTTAHALGIVTIAPLVVGVYHLASERIPRNELIEGSTALALLAVVSTALYSAPKGSWLSQVPPAVLFPFLLWIAARCRPMFAATAAFVICGVLLGATILRLGPFADTDPPILSVQATMLIASLCALSLAAVFAERRRSEAALRESNERLRLALDGAQLGVWSADLATGAFESDERDRRINGHDPAAPPLTLAQVRRFVHPDDVPRLDRAFAAARRTGATCQAEYRVLGPGNDRSPETRWVAVEGTVVRNAAGQAVRLLGVTRDVTERKQVEAQKDLLLAELDHRVKNALAVVAALVSRTQETSGSAAELAAALDGRIKSMAITHELLSGRKWQGLPLAALIERELEPYATGSNVHIKGPDVILRAEAGQSLAMVVHELVTNAAKYGALSVERGRVSVEWWRRVENGSGSELVLDWAEADGPGVAESARPGYGTSVIRDLIPYELRGSVDLTLAPEGIRCRLHIPAKWLCAAERPTDTEANGPAHFTAGAPQIPSPCRAASSRKGRGFGE